jgi:hypothetical protein
MPKKKNIVCKASEQTRDLASLPKLDLATEEGKISHQPCELDER